MKRLGFALSAVGLGVALALYAAFPVTAQPASTTVTVTSIAAGNTNIGDVDVASSALPTGASTEATLSGVLTSVQSITTAVQLLDNVVVVEDAVAGSAFSGIAPLAVRNDAGTPLAADADFHPLMVNSAGALYVTGGGGGVEYTEGDVDATIVGKAQMWEDAGNALVVTSAAKPMPVSCGDCSGTGVSHVDDAAFTVATDDVVPAAGIFDDVSPDSVNEGDAGAIRMSANRNLYVTLRDHTSERGTSVTAANELLVTGAVTNAGTFAVQVTGSLLTSSELLDNIVRAEDVASAGGHEGAVVMARRTDTPANQSGTDGDYEFLQVSAGRLWTSTTVTGTVTVDSELPTAGALADNTSNPTTTTIAAFLMCFDGSTWDRCTQSTVTDATHDGALTVATTVGNVSMARASATEPTNVSTGDDAVMLWALPSGALATTLRDSSGADITDTVNTAVRVNIVAGAAAGGTSITDDSAFTVASSALTPVGGTYRAARDAVTDGDAGAFAMTINRGLYISPETPLGDSMADDTLDTLKVSQATAANLNATVVGTGTFAVQVSSLPASTNTIEVVGDAAADAAVAGNPLLMGARSSAAAPADVSADNEVAMLWALRNGALAVNPTFSGTLAAVNNGGVSAGTLRVTVANDSTGILAGVTTVSTVTTISQLGGVALPIEDAAETAGGVGIYAMTVRRDAPSSSAGVTSDNATLNTDGNGYLWVRTGDPCTALPKQYVAINQTTGTQLFAGTASNRTYVCSISVVTASAQNIALISGTGTVCATSSGPMMGGTTAATGWNFAANGGISAGNGSGTIAKSDTDADNVCLLQSAAGQISGVIAYVVAPG